MDTVLGVEEGDHRVVALGGDQGVEQAEGLAGDTPALQTRSHTITPVTSGTAQQAPLTPHATRRPRAAAAGRSSAGRGRGRGWRQ